MKLTEINNKIFVLKREINKYPTGKVPAGLLKDFSALTRERSVLLKNLPVPR